MIILSEALMPYPYTVDAMVTRPRSVVRKKFVDVGFVESTIREISFSDAPVVLTYTMEPGGISHAVRYFDGSFYVPLASNSSGFARNNQYGHVPKSALPSRGKRGWNAETMLYMLQLERNSEVFPDKESAALTRALSEGMFFPDVRAADVAEVLSSNEAGRRQAARHVLESLLVIKRDVWLKVGEPRFIVHKDPHRDRQIAALYNGPTGIGSSARTFSFLPIGPPSRTRFFSVFELEEFAKVAGSRGAAPQEFREFEVHDASVFTTDWRLVEAELLVSHAVEAFGAEMGSQSAGTVSSWLEVRDRLAAWRATGDRGLLDTALEIHLPALVSDFDGAATSAIDEIAEGLSVVGAYVSPSADSLSSAGPKP